ncbi:GGDEF domain-containing protein [Halopseudomonas salegens]|uniref:diguanylate cyclase n=1 Tax=Halopseudomonas salegens TaxID=1434072 RepID=A0A1H2F5E8_9GAMM|nr:GGDEF domain-containing protein [Halopseudomonas salegens]SDU02596.1 diguanylate cyclase (GGDEF) domain-containing protein [Halopseudomonas salegens]
MNDNHKVFAPLSKRLLQRLALLAVLSILFGSLVHSLLIYRAEQQQFSRLVDQLTANHLPLLQVALWDIEVDALRQQVTMIADREEVATVILSSPTGLHLQAGAAVADDYQADARVAISPPNGGAHALGELQIYYQRERLNKAIVAAVAMRFFELSLFTLLVCLVIFRFLRRDLVRPLNSINRYVAELLPQRHPPRLKLDRPPRPWEDEIDRVAAGFDTLREGIRHYAEQHENALQALETERDSLDSRVAARTRELAFVNGYQELTSRSIQGFMQARPAEYPDYLRRVLQDLAEYLGLDACALLDRRHSRPWVTRVAWFVHDDWPWLERVLTHGCEVSVEEGWSQYFLTGAPNTLLVRFSGREQSFVLAVRTSEEAAGPLQQDMLESSGKWLLSLLQRWDHMADLDSARQELLEMSRSDHLTGLANRRHFDAYKIDEARRALRMGAPVALLMIDVDHFKDFNDLYGHSRGDQCLVALAEQMQWRFKRAADLPARLGGEEFAILLPGYNSLQAQEAAEGLRQSIFDLAITHRGSPFGFVSVSIGCVWWPGQHGQANPVELMNDLVNQADAALYQAKGEGRNRVVYAEFSDLNSPAQNS